MAVPSSSRTQAVSRSASRSPSSWALPVTPVTSSTAASSYSPALSAEMRYWTVSDVSPIANVTRLLAEPSTSVPPLLLVRPWPCRPEPAVHGHWAGRRFGKRDGPGQQTEIAPGILLGEAAPYRDGCIARGRCSSSRSQRGRWWWTQQGPARRARKTCCAALALQGFSWGRACHVRAADASRILLCRGSESTLPCSGNTIMNRPVSECSAAW